MVRDHARKKAARRYGVETGMPYAAARAKFDDGVPAVWRRVPVEDRLCRVCRRRSDKVALVYERTAAPIWPWRCEGCRSLPPFAEQVSSYALVHGIDPVEAERILTHHERHETPDEQNSRVSSAAGVRAWEARRAARPLRQWSAVIEIRVAAPNRRNARSRLLHQGLRPWTRVLTAELDGADFLCCPPDDPECRGEELASIPDDELSRDERDRLIANYPTKAPDHLDELIHLGVGDIVGVTHNVMALRLTAQLLRGNPRTATSAQHNAEKLSFWRAVWPVDFIAADRIEATDRAFEFAASVVDVNGHTIGRVNSLKPTESRHFDGVRHHEASWDLRKVHALWDDYELAREPLHDPLKRAAFLDAVAEHLHTSWCTDYLDYVERGEQVENALHRELTRARSNGRSREELLQLATQAEFLAEHVYGLEHDSERYRITRTEAATYRDLATEP